MVIKKRAALFLILVFLLPPFLFAKTKKKKEAARIIRNENDIYYFEDEETGKPVFTQILKWTSSPAVYYYLVTLKTESGRIVFSRRKTETSSLEVNLKPGKYTYKVYVFNLLDVLDKESDWLPIEIKKASLPIIKTISPSHLYIEDGKFDFTITGRNFTEYMDIFFKAEKGERVQRVKPISLDKNKIAFVFKRPERFLDSPYVIHIIDPSGLEGKSDTFTVKYRKPFDIYAGAAYTPYVPVSDSWYTGLWNKKFYPFGLTGEAGIVFSKHSFGFFGAELRTSYRRTNTVREETGIKNDTFTAAVTLFYEWWFIRKLALCIKAGGGMAMNTLQFRYSGGLTDKKALIFDGMYTAGLGLRAKPVKFLYIDVMLYMEQILNKGVKPIGIIPELAVGFRY